MRKKLSRSCLVLKIKLFFNKICCAEYVVNAGVIFMAAILKKMQTFPTHYSMNCFTHDITIYFCKIVGRKMQCSAHMHNRKWRKSITCIIINTHILRARFCRARPKVRHNEKKSIIAAHLSCSPNTTLNPRSFCWDWDADRLKPLLLSNFT